MDVITTHINADFDCLGSMIAARRLYPDAVLVFAGGEERGVREFLMESVRYAYNFKRVREVDLSAIKRLILVDVAHRDRIGPFAEVADRSDVELHIYDHHPEGEGNLRGSVERVEPVGSTVTVMTEIFRERQILPEPDEATMMMLGLYEDTGSLLFTSTTGRDFQAAAFLAEAGANLATVADFLTRELTYEQVQLLHELLNSRRTLTVNGIDIGIAHASTDHFVGDLAILANKVKEMENLPVLIVAARMGDRIFLVGRSRLPEVHVGEILAEFGGGGHPHASSGTVRNLTLIQVLEQLPEVLHRHVRHTPVAQEIMSSPVRTVNVDDSIAAVRALLTRYNVNSVPVLKGGSPVGVITRQMAERASHHGLDAVAVEEVMREDFATVAPDASLEILHDLIVEKNLRILPVIDAGQLVGVVTRTDLLHYFLHEVRTRRGDRPLGEGGGEGQIRSLANLIRDRLPKRISSLLQQAGAVADELGVDVYVVGGFVRDLLLARRNLDVDLVVEGDGIAFAERFCAPNGCRVRSHPKFGTAVLVFEDGFKVDVASTRMEYYREPGALPTVEHASIKLDLYRRDFSINTLAVALNPSRYGQLLDYFGGQRDLKERVIRVLHSLSFVEDPTRVFRAVRFEQRLGFTLGRQTEQLLKSAARMGFLHRAGGARLLNELILILKEEDPRPALRRMEQLSLFPVLEPSLRFSAQSEMRLLRCMKLVSWFELTFPQEPLAASESYLIVLLDSLQEEAIDRFIEAYSLPPKLGILLGRDRRQLLSRFQQLLRQFRTAEPASSARYRLLHGYTVELILAVVAHLGDERAERWAVDYLLQQRREASELNGDDLKALGIQPGPGFRQILDCLLDARLDGLIANREEEISFVRKLGVGDGSCG